jgi:uncharacterized protein YndB with AHSA1/START domain
VLREGVICILMATPLFVVLAVVGALVGALVSAFGKSQGPKLLSVALVAPLLAAQIEGRVASDTARQTVAQSIHISAPPETVWRQINFPLDIRPEELAGGIAYRIGVPYPIEARTVEGRVGGKRALLWQRGVSFEEEITAWEPNRHIAWTYKFGPDSFPPGSLDDHIVIGGRYFDLETTSYTLQPEQGGTRLSILVRTRVTTNFNWYAGFWADALVSDTAAAILRFYKLRSERSSQG